MCLAHVLLQSPDALQDESIIGGYRGKDQTYSSQPWQIVCRSWDLRAQASLHSLHGLLMPMGYGLSEVSSQARSSRGLASGLSVRKRTLSPSFPYEQDVQCRENRVAGVVVVSSGDWRLRLQA